MVLEDDSDSSISLPAQCADDLDRTDWSYNNKVLVEVNLKKDESDGLGFNIHGGWDTPYIGNDSGIFITKIRERGSAENDGRLSVGDRIVKLNGQSLENLSHPTVVNLFRTSESSVTILAEKSAQHKKESIKSCQQGSWWGHGHMAMAALGIGTAVLFTCLYRNRFQSPRGLVGFH